MKIADIGYDNTAQVSDQGYLLTKGIEDWISTLATYTEGGETPQEGYVWMEDPETGARFEIRKLP